MAFSLAYCADGHERLKRLHRLYENRDQNLVLAVMNVDDPAARALSATLPSGYCEYPDPLERAHFWDSMLQRRSEIFDDSIPSAYLSEMDQGLYGGLLGGKVLFLSNPQSGWVSSMVSPILNDWSELDELDFSTDSEWFGRYVRQMQVFVEVAQGKFGVSHFICINGLNLVFELVGATETYRALIERPDGVRRALELAHRLNAAVQRTFFEYVPLLERGTCSTMAQWLPGRVISESIDPFHMTSVSYFEEWGRQPLERLADQFDGVAIHIHGNGRHLLPAAATLKRLKAIMLGDDKGYPAAFEVLPTLRQQAGDVPLIVSVPFAAFYAALREHRLIGGVLYVVQSVPDPATANRCMEEVRVYDE